MKLIKAANKLRNYLKQHPVICLFGGGAVFNLYVDKDDVDIQISLSKDGDYIPIAEAEQLLTELTSILKELQKARNTCDS